MSFRCQHCHEPRPNKEHPEERTPVRVVTATRSYAKRSGSEIVQELSLCRDCGTRAKLAGPKHVVLPNR